MAEDSRTRFAEVVRDPHGDLAEAALLCCAETDPDFDLGAELARVDELAAGLRRGGFEPSDPRADAAALSSYLAGELGFTGDTADYHAPANGLLTSVLDRRRGLPITLAICYIAVGRRVGVDAFGLNVPAHFLVGVGERSEDRALGATVAIDAFHAGAVLDADEVAARLRAASGGALSVALLRPATPTEVMRRLLNNLTRDYLARSDAANARWTVEYKRLLPDTGPEDVGAHSDVLAQLGRYREAAETVERYLAEEQPDADAVEELAGLARRNRAQLN